MIAALLTKLPATNLEFAEFDEPVPGPGEVLVQVAACGICGTDLHVMAGQSYRPDLPFVLGHELVGTVVSAADSAGGRWLGRRVVPTLFTGCGGCGPCRSGNERLCEHGALVVGVVGRPGGFAGQVVLRADQLVEVPTAISDAVAASLVDAGATARNAVRSALALAHHGEARYLVIGGGPVGLLVSELLLSSGKEVVVVESNPLRRSLLAERQLVVAPSLSEADGSFTTVIDCAGSPELVQVALGLLRSRGLYLVVGYSTVPELDLSLVARRELVLRGVRSGSRADLEDVIRLVSSGKVAPPPVTTWPLRCINEALLALREGQVEGKAVVLNSVGPAAGTS